MKIAIPKERRPQEARVAASPETVKKLVALGQEVTVEKGAGTAAGMLDAAYEEAGASIAKDAKTAVSGADIVLKVQGPTTGGQSAELSNYKKDTVLISVLDPLRKSDEMEAIAKAGLTAFAMDLMPRITRAQSMDVLSSQANLAGYKAVIDAADNFGRAFPLMMTAAGRVNPAKVLVMGAGVAGLQAIATAKRLGAMVFATDVRPAAKEQVESLGGKFVAVEDEEFQQAEAEGGYAKEMSDGYKKKQAELLADTVKDMDVIVTTALIPGRPAPKLVDEAMVKSMKPGSVIVDLAVETGGNVALSEANKVVTKHGVTLVGYTNVPSRLPADTSALYARNVYNFLEVLIDKESGKLAIDWDDDLVKGTLIAKEGKVVHPALTGEKDAPKKEAEESKSDKDESAEKDAKAADSEKADTGKES